MNNTNFLEDNTEKIITGILEGIASKYLDNGLLAEIKIKVTGYTEDKLPLLSIKAIWYEGEA